METFCHHMNSCLIERGDKMIFVMLSPLFIIGFIALSIFEEKRRKKNETSKKDIK